MASGTYVLVTPAKNEEDYIERTIRSVISQTCLPVKWVVVSDGSVDRTDAIVQSYCTEYPFMELVRAGEGEARNFGSKAGAFRAGYERLERVAYDCIGNLDADVSFAEDYFSRLLEAFDGDPGLGLVGGIIQEKIGSRYVTQNISLNSVAGALQLFRRACFEDVGGYLPLKLGGIDAAAEIMARMHGWSVRTFPELPVLHHRRVAYATGNMLRARYRQGKMYYNLGYHPLFQLVRCMYKMKDDPLLLGGLSLFLGYLDLYAKREPRQVPEPVVEYLQAEQMERLRRMFHRGSHDPAR